MSLSTRLQDLAVRIGTEVKALRTLLNGNAADLGGLTTTAKSNLVAAINELDADIAALSGSSGGASINDGITSAAATWSSQKIAEEDTASRSRANHTGTQASATISDFDTAVQAIADTRLQAVVGAAPEALDTLAELAAALGDDPNFAGTLTTALGNRVRVDAGQAFTAGEQAQGRSNIAAASTAALNALAAELGNTDPNLVTTFEAALA
jgi:hypothetical protein